MTDHTAAVAELLAGLGDTPDAVADTLRARGIKGVPGDCERCAVATLIRRETGLGAQVCLYPTPEGEVTGTAYLRTGPDDEVRVALPDAAARFARRFDEGVYLDLVEEP